MRKSILFPLACPRAIAQPVLFGSRIGICLLSAATLVLNAGAGTKSEAPAIGTAFVVNSSGDQPEATPDNQCETAIGNGVCTLRAAIQLVNARNNGGDGIFFNIPASDPGCSEGVCTINLASALPDLSTGVNISGPGAATLTVQRSTASNTPIFRIFNATTTVGGPVSLSGLAIVGGFASGNGGGIQNTENGTVNLTNCSIVGNQALNGGGIANASTGHVNLTSCTLYGNTAQLSNGSCSGGGIYNPSGMVSITNSLLESNSVNASTTSGFSAFGGGVYNNGTLTITNSTLFDNLAVAAAGAGDGGGIYNTGTATITNSTINANNVPGGQPTVNADGIQNHGTVQVKNSIIAGNVPSAFRGNPRPASDVVGTFQSSGFNLVGVRDGSTGFTAATDQTGTAAAPLDPKFELSGGSFAGLPFVQDNGGATETLALVCGSPAIDKGSSAGLTGNLTTDQRGTGFARTVNDPGIPNASGGDGTDIGAFEYGAGPIMPTSVVSRKFHGTGNPFDIPLPLSCASMGIECRRNTGADTTGPNMGHDHELIVTFGSNVTVATVDVVNDSTDLITGTADFSVSNNVVTVDLHNIPNAVRLNINLRGVSDGTNSGLVSIPMGVLLGDVNGSARVDSTDVSLVRQQTLQTLSSSNFREDINVSGRIDATDVSIARQQTLTSLP